MQAIEFRIAFTARDFERSVAFYEDTLGFERTGGWDRADGKGALLSAGGNAVVEIFGAAAGESYDGPTPSGVALAIQVADVEAWYTRLADARIDTGAPPVTHPWGHRGFTIRDPDGLAIHLYSVIED